MEILSIRPKAHGNRFLMADMWTEILRVGERGHRDRERERESWFLTPSQPSLLFQGQRMRETETEEERERKLVFNAQSAITVISESERMRDRQTDRQRVREMKRGWW